MTILTGIGLKTRKAKYKGRRWMGGAVFLLALEMSSCWRIIPAAPRWRRSTRLHDKSGTFGWSGKGNWVSLECWISGEQFPVWVKTFFSLCALCTKPCFIQHLFFRIFFSLHIYFNGGRIKLAFFFSSERRLFFDGRTEVNFNFAKWWRELKEERASLHFNRPTSTFLAPMPFLAKNLKSSSHSFTKINYRRWDSLRSQDPRSNV